MTRLCLIRLFALCTLAGCDSASLPFQGIEPHYVSVQGMDFAVRIDQSDAEAIRLNAMRLRDIGWPKMDRVGTAAALAIEQASGCEVLQIRGDPAVVTARIRCS